MPSARDGWYRVLTRSLDAADTDSSPILLDDRTTATVALDDGLPGRLVNAGGSGYYRVSYPPAMVERLAAGLADLAPLERYNLVSDTWAASLAGQAPLADLLRLARALVELGRRRPECVVGSCSARWACSTGSSPTPTDR